MCTLRSTAALRGTFVKSRGVGAMGAMAVARMRSEEGAGEDERSRVPTGGLVGADDEHE